MAKLEGWVAKFVARLLVTTNSLGLNPDIPQKSKMGRAALAKKLLTHSSPPKKIHKKCVRTGLSIPRLLKTTENTEI